jgi:hypothetical protein
MLGANLWRTPVSLPFVCRQIAGWALGQQQARVAKIISGRRGNDGVAERVENRITGQSVARDFASAGTTEAAAIDERSRGCGLVGQEYAQVAEIISGGSGDDGVA